MPLSCFLCIFPSVSMPFSLSRLSSFTPCFILSLFCFILCFFLSYYAPRVGQASLSIGEENTNYQRNPYVSHFCSVVLTYATRASGCGAQGSFQQRRERLARATTRRPLDTTSFVHTPGIPILSKTMGPSTVAAATCLKSPSQPNVLRRVPKD